MKTLEQINSEISDYRKQAENENLSKKEAKQIEKALRKLNDCRLYLETNPRHDFIEKQKEDCKKKISIINAGFSDWLNNNRKEAEAVKNPKSKYHTVMGLKTIKQQLATLNFLLS